MDNIKLKRYKLLLRSHKQNLQNWLNSRSSRVYRVMGYDSSKTNSASLSKDDLVITKIDDALNKINKGSFGQCELCDGEIEEECLALDFTTCVCLDHYSDHQIKDLERDLELAAKVQKQLFPQEIPEIEGVEISVRTEPAKIVGGDYFDFFNFRNSLKAFTIADVMGKGLPASMLMSNLQASLRILGPENDTLEKTVSRLNELFRFNLKTIKFITMFIGSIDTKNKILYYCNAGHNPPIWLNSKNTIKYLNYYTTNHLTSEIEHLPT